ncbi:MAG: hypothetical protein AAF490_01815 [Chloroflexota bacterium]
MSQDSLIILTFIGEAIFWLGAYFIVIRIGFKEKIHAMPIAAMCGNISWEIILGIGLFPACPVYWADCPSTFMQVGTLAAAALDGVIFFTILRYGRSQFQLPWFRRHYHLIVLMAFGVAFLFIHGFMKEVFTRNIFQATVNGTIPPFLEDGLQGGIYTGWGLALMMGLLFIALNTIRPKMQGQSFYLALFMFLGNLSAFFFDMATMNQIPILLLILVIPTLIINLLYVGLTYQQTFMIKENPISLLLKQSSIFILFKQHFYL